MLFFGSMGGGDASFDESFSYLPCLHDADLPRDPYFHVHCNSVAVASDLVSFRTNSALVL